MKLSFFNLVLYFIEISKSAAWHQDDYTLVYERTEVVRADERYVKMKTHNFKYNRTQAVTNFTVEFKVDFGNHMKGIVQGYKFASNEYRLFPIVFDRNVCQCIKENEFGLQNIYTCGNVFSCPMKKGNYTICNWSIDGPQLPPYIPSGHYMLEVKYDYISSEIFVLNVYVTIKRFFDRR